MLLTSSSVKHLTQYVLLSNLFISMEQVTAQVQAAGYTT